jgi:hypothetical protein
VSEDELAVSAKKTAPGSVCTSGDGPGLQSSPSPLRLPSVNIKSPEAIGTYVDSLAVDFVGRIAEKGV